jgi:hypothetical protein
MAIFMIAAAVGLSSFWLPAPLGINAPATAFSAERAFEHIKAMAKAPHPTGSAENARVREYLLGRMRELGLNPAEMKGAPNGIEVVNLYGELGGSDKSAAKILLMAHYDTTPRGPGAADDTTGVAVVLETIRAVKARGAVRNTIGVLLTDGEEVHGVCLGANLFANQQTNLMRDLRVIVNLEARGNRGPVLMFQTGADNNGLIQLFGAACPLPVAASFSEDIYRRMPNDTDLTEFLKAGKRGYNFAFTSGIEFYHSPQDTPENLSQRTLQHYGANVLPLVAKLGDADEATFAKCLEAGDATFFTVCRGVLVRYSAAVARILTVLATALFAFALVRLLSRGTFGIKKMFISLAVTLLAAIVAALIGLAVVFGVMRLFKPQSFGPFIVGVRHNEWILLGLVVVAISLTKASRIRLLRNASSAEQLAGCLIVWVALTIVTALMLPGASYLFMWPTGLAALSLFFANSKFTSLLTAAPAPLLLVPTILMLHQTITIGIAPVSAALIALAVCLEPLEASKAKPLTA